MLDRLPTLVSCIDEKSGYTPLHFAARHNAVQAAELLLQRGADANAADAQGYGPLRLSGGQEVARLLRRHGALFSTAYQTLKEAHASGRLVRLVYQTTVCTICIVRLGVGDGEERCLAWQRNEPDASLEPGIRCFRVRDMSELEMLGQHSGYLAGDLSLTSECVELSDELFEKGT